VRIFIAASERSRLSGRVEELGQLNISFRNALGVVSGEVDGDAVVNVEPFRMVAHFLNA
jgi:hypothetical protein